MGLAVLVFNTGPGHQPREGIAPCRTPQSRNLFPARGRGFYFAWRGTRFVCSSRGWRPGPGPVLTIPSLSCGKRSVVPPFLAASSSATVASTALAVNALLARNPILFPGCLRHHWYNQEVAPPLPYFSPDSQVSTSFGALGVCGGHKCLHRPHANGKSASRRSANSNDRGIKREVAGLRRHSNDEIHRRPAAVGGPR